MLSFVETWRPNRARRWAGRLRWAACLAAVAAAGCNFIDPPNIPPLFRQHPDSVTVNDGASATFTAEIDNYYKETHDYNEIKWSIDGVVVPGASGNSFSRVFLYADNGKQVRAIAWLGAGSVGNSNPATVTVLPVAPTLSGTMPTTVTLAPGVPFQITAPPLAGTLPMTFQWFRDGSPIVGATSAVFTIPAVAAADSGAQFTVTASNRVGSVASNACLLIVQ